MSEQTKAWCLADKKGRLLLWMMAYTEDGAWLTAEENYELEREQLRPIGFTVIPVTITKETP